MANIQINELPLVTTASATDVLVINVNNQVTSAISFLDFSADLNVFTKPGYFPDGTAASPSISFTNDQNTGFFRPGTDSVGITTAGTQRAIVNASGNMGIGVNSPNARLEVGGDTRFTVTSGITVAMKKSDVSSDPLFATLTVTPLLMGVNNSEKMRIDSDGSVLVGTTTNTNSSKLVVNGQVEIQNALISNGGTNNNLKFEANNVDFLQFNESGAAAFNNDYGTDGKVLISQGTGLPPKWASTSVDPSFFDFRNLPNINDAP
jgi:hypothetical protein